MPSKLSVLTSWRMLALHAVALVAVTIAVLLGLWQFEAWGERREAETNTLTDAAPMPLDAVMSSDDPYPADAIGQPVELTGRWLPENTFYVSDREQSEGEWGYWAVTPVAVCDVSTTAAACQDRPALLVVRGWTTSPGDAPPAPTGVVELEAWLQPAEGTGVQDDDPTDDVLPQVRIGDAIQRVDQDLYGAYAISRTADGGLEEVSPDSLPAPETFTAIRNLLYAIEWWVFAGFAGFIWWRWCRDELNREIGPHGDGDHLAGDPETSAPPVPSRP